MNKDNIQTYLNVFTKNNKFVLSNYINIPINHFIYNSNHYIYLLDNNINDETKYNIVNMYGNIKFLKCYYGGDIQHQYVINKNNIYEYFKYK